MQNTNYFLSESSDHKSTFIDQVQWIQIKDWSKYSNLVMRHLDKKDELSKVDLYYVESQCNSNRFNAYYTILIYVTSQLKSLIKLDKDFVLLNRFIVKNQSQNKLTIASRKADTIIVEKIYFLNRNLKVIKSTIREGNSCKGISFSSEIRISQ